jgi:hypothetical protein
MSDDVQSAVIANRLRAWGYGQYLPVFAAGMCTAEYVNDVVPAFEAAIASVFAEIDHTVFHCAMGRRHVVGCATLKLLFPEGWWTRAFVFSRANVVMAGPVANLPLFVLSELPVGDMVAPDAYELTFFSLCNQPEWVKQLLAQIVDDHREENETGCWSTLFDTFTGIKQVLMTESVISYDYSMAFGMVEVKSHDHFYWSSLLQIYDPTLVLMDSAEAPSDNLVTHLKTIYSNADFPILTSMKPYFWRLNGSHLFYAGYNIEEDCFLIGKCGLDGSVI